MKRVSESRWEASWLAWVVGVEGGVATARGDIPHLLGECIEEKAKVSAHDADIDSERS